MPLLSLYAELPGVWMQESCDKGIKRKVVIIGAGPAGLTAAYELCKTGVESVVLEKDPVVGGISRTVNYKDYYFDIGGHRFFTKVKRVNDMWNEVLGDDFLNCRRLSRIYYNKRYFYYPLKPLNTLIGVGFISSLLIVSSYLNSKMFPLRHENTFEQWVSNRFGKRLYKTFFKTYTENVWGIPCSEISAEWAAQRIKGLSLVIALKNALINSQNNTGNRNVVKTLIDNFDYPRLGPGMVWNAVAENVKSNGSQVHLEVEVEEIRWTKNKIEALDVNINGHKEHIEGTDFVSSMPIRDLIQRFRPDVPVEVLKAANCLNYRDFIMVSLIVDKRDVFPDNWIYIHDPCVKLCRIQNFKNWSSHMVPDQKKTCLGLEYFCFEGDELWTMADRELIELGKKELKTLGLIQMSSVIDGKVIRMPKAYPVYDFNYKERLLVVKQFLSRFENLQLVGRNGMHRYNNQDHSMLTAMLAVENILGENHDLWEVNEEAEYHEEDKTLVPDENVVRAFARIDKLGFATAIGSVAGLFVFAATIWLVIKNGLFNWPSLNPNLLDQYFIGYSVSVQGAFLGMVYCFAWGFLFGWLFAYIRNLFIGYFIYRVKKKVELLSFRDFLEHF